MNLLQMSTDEMNDNGLNRSWILQIRYIRDRLRGYPQPRQLPERSRCQALAKDGQSCSRFTSPGSKYCWQHQPKLRRHLTRVIMFVVTLVGFITAVWQLMDYLGEMMAVKPEECGLNGLHIAVAEFVALGQDGTVVASRQSEEIARDTHRRIAAKFGSKDGACSDRLISGKSVAVWPPEFVGVIEGATPEARALAAKDRARELNADILIYGFIDIAGQERTFHPGFYVNASGFDQAQELEGSYGLGRGLPLGPDTGQFSINNALERRTEALVLITFGMAHMADNQFEIARSYLEEAKTLLEDEEGKDVVHLLIGNTFLHLASQQELEEEEYLDQALEAYEEVLKLDCAEVGCSHARALLGKAIVLMRQGIGDSSAEDLQSRIDMLLLDEAIELYEQVLRLPYPSEANVEIKAHLGLGEALLHKAIATEDCTVFHMAQTELEKVVLEYDAGNTGVSASAAIAYAGLGYLARYFAGVDDLQIPILYYQNAAALSSKGNATNFL